jgi:hypothetical protein
MHDPVSKEELEAALKESAGQTAELLIHEMDTRFAEVRERLDRMDQTLSHLGKHVLKLRVAKLENPGS